MEPKTTKPNRSIFKTLKAILGSDTPLSVEALEQYTGFGKRRVQRHVDILSDVGMVNRIGINDQGGYSYSSALPISVGQLIFGITICSRKLLTLL